MINYSPVDPTLYLLFVVSRKLKLPLLSMNISGNSRTENILGAGFDEYSEVTNLQLSTENIKLKSLSPGYDIFLPSRITIIELEICARWQRLSIFAGKGINSL